MNESDYGSIVRSATEIAQAPLADSSDGERGVDEPTRTAARSFLAAQFELWKFGPEGIDDRERDDDPNDETQE